MRRFITLGIVIGLASIMSSPAQAATIAVTHKAPIPCSGPGLCPYWDPSVPRTLSYHECGQPFPEGSFDKTTFAFTSTVTGAAIDIVAQSDIDYDTFVCTNTQPSLLVAALANTIPGDCDSNILGPTPAPTIGCTEVGTITWSALVATIGYPPPAKDFIVISYNYSDNNTNRVTLTGPVVTLDDSFTPICPANLSCPG